MVGPLQLSVVVALLVAVATVTSLAIAVYSWRTADHPISDRFALLMAVDGLWAGTYLLQLVSPSDALARFWLPVETLAATLAAVFWFLFVIEYTGDSDWIPDIVEPLAVGHAVVYGVVFALNPGGLVAPSIAVEQFGVLRLPSETIGPIALAEIVVIYTLLSLSFVLLFRFFLKTRNLYRKQTGIILGVTTIVVVANAAYLSGFSPHPQLDLTTVFFVVQAVGVAFALYRYDFLNVAPLAANTLLEEMHDPVFVVDNRGRIVDYNDAATAYIRGEDEHPTLSNVDINEFESVLERCDGGVEGTEVTTTKQAGQRTVAVTYDVRTTPIRDQFGEVRGNVVVLRDVTERKAREQALASQNERLEEFAGVVSHDLRNPLEVIDGRIRLAQETGDLEHLDDASHAVGRMETLIDDLLRLAKEGQTIDETEPVDLASLCKTAWDHVDAEGCTLSVETEQTVAADPSRLQEALENLFRNAVEHGCTTPDSQARQNAVEHDTHVTVGDTEDGFFVADDGPGIPEAKRDDVFELGYTTSNSGTGFGLAIVRRIIEAHGWSIRITESESGGARFEITDLYPLAE